MWQLAYGAAPTASELTAVSDMLTQELKRQEAVRPETAAKDAKADSFTALIASSDVRTRALAALCQVVFASNRFLYAP